MKIFLLLIVISTTKALILDSNLDYSEDGLNFYIKSFDDLYSFFKTNYDRIYNLLDYFWEENYKFEEFPFKDELAIERLKAKIAARGAKSDPKCKILNNKDLDYVYNQTLFDLGKKFEQTFEEYKSSVLEPIDKDFQETKKTVIEPLREHYLNANSDENRKFYVGYLLYIVKAARQQYDEISKEMTKNREDFIKYLKDYLFKKNDIEHKLQECEKAIEQLPQSGIVSMFKITTK